MAIDYTLIKLRQLGQAQLGIEWSDGHLSQYQVRRLRLACRCASCVDEWTHEKLLKEENVPENVVPKRIDTVGRYALTIQWSDGHDTGIYTFEVLRALCECPRCRNQPNADPPDTKELQSQ